MFIVRCFVLSPVLWALSHNQTTRPYRNELLPRSPVIGSMPVQVRPDGPKFIVVIKRGSMSVDAKIIESAIMAGFSLDKEEDL